MAKYNNPTKTWRYTNKFKAKAVQLSLLEGVQVQDVEKKLGENNVAIPQLNGREFLTLLIACIAVLGFTATIWILSHYLSKQKEAILALIKKDYLLLRMFTVLFIIWAATSLALIGALNEAISALFSGIAGFVLGGIKSDVSRSIKGSPDDIE